MSLGEKNCHVEIYGRCEKKQCFSIEGQKKTVSFLILEMEGWRIRNPKNIISEALLKTQNSIHTYIPQPGITGANISNN
jgi:hypothetical protein